MIVCVQTSNKEQRARALSASLPLSLPTKAVHTMVFQGTSAPSIPPSIRPARISSQPSRPETSSSPSKSATAAPMAISKAACLFSPQPLLSWSAQHDVTGPFDGLPEEAQVPDCSLLRSLGRTARSWSCGTRARRLRCYTQEKIRLRTTGRWIHI